MNKPCVFLLPGLLCDAGIWQHQLAFLSRGFDARVPVFRGFSAFRDMALHVLENAPARFSVVGHSMGARVALEVMEVASERVDHLVLLNFGAHPVTPDEPARRVELMNLADRDGLDSVAELLIMQMFAPRSRSNLTLMDDFRAMVRRNSVADFKGQIQAALNRGDHRSCLARIEIPVLLICGELDTWSPVAQHRDSLALLRHGELEVIADAGHMTPMETPRRVSELLFRWLNDFSHSERRLI